MVKKRLLNTKKAGNYRHSQHAGIYDFESSLEAYFKEISNIPLLRREDEYVLGKKIQKGDQKSLKELVQRNLRYVVSVAYVYKGCGVSLLDLIGEGNIGLIQAALRFDPFRNVKFITYASWWIRQAIRHALAEQSGAVRLPAKQAVLLNKINAKNKAFLQEHERVPTSEDLAKELGLSVEEVESILRAYRSHLSLNAPLKNKKEANYLELLKSKNTNSIEDNVLLDSLRYKIEEFLKELSPREEKVLRCRFGFDQKGPFTLEKIAKEMHLSRERVRQIEKKATERLRSKRKIKILKDFLN